MSNILLAEYTLKRALRENSADLVLTSCPHVLCTSLPKHWRSNKSLPNQFRVVCLLDVPDGTRVSVTAWNEEHPIAELKNHITVMHANEGRFSDLRFLGRSGRGKSFNITITIETTPPLVAIYSRAIKVTVDGPRVPRNKYSSLRTANIHREARRNGIRHLKGVDNRLVKCSRSHNADKKHELNRIVLGMSSAITRHQTRRYRDQLAAERILFRNSALGPEDTVGKAETPHRLPSQMCPTDPTVKGLNLSVQQTPSEKLPSSNEKSVPFLGVETGSNVQLSLINSTCLLSSINEAYARLLARQTKHETDVTSRQPHYGFLPTSVNIPSAAPVIPATISDIPAFATENYTRINEMPEDLNKAHFSNVSCLNLKCNELNLTKDIQMQSELSTCLDTRIIDRVGLCKQNQQVITQLNSSFLTENVSGQISDPTTHPTGNMSFIPQTTSYLSALPVNSEAAVAEKQSLPYAGYSALQCLGSYINMGTSPYEPMLYNALKMMQVQMQQHLKVTDKEEPVNRYPAASVDSAMEVERSGVQPLNLTQNSTQMRKNDLCQKQTTSAFERPTTILSIERLLEANDHELQSPNPRMNNASCRSKLCISQANTFSSFLPPYGLGLLFGPHMLTGATRSLRHPK
ncbi:unnamed protein product [Dicrocoelium dendriticum]|nr:unnamed protein product [Dicrocoelium dendriticum]